MADRHGDFFRCDSPGAGEAKRSVLNIVPIMADPSAYSVFKEVVELADKKKYHPVIKLSGTQLKILKHSLLHEGSEFDAPTNEGIHYLIHSIEIIQENYEL